MINEVNAIGAYDRGEFLSHVYIEPNGCHAWKRLGNRAENSTFGICGKSYSVRRLAYLIAFGRACDGVVRSTCGNVWCINPGHLVSAPDFKLIEAVRIRLQKVDAGTEALRSLLDKLLHGVTQIKG